MHGVTKLENLTMTCSKLQALRIRVAKKEDAPSEPGLPDHVRAAAIVCIGVAEVSQQNGSAGPSADVRSGIACAVRDESCTLWQRDHPRRKQLAFNSCAVVSCTLWG